jgi:hypothetical protein
MKLPSCCSQEMKVKLESQRFVEVACQNCNDIIYLKKTARLPNIFLEAAALEVR